MLKPTQAVRAFKSPGLVSALCHRSEAGAALSSRNSILRVVRFSYQRRSFRVACWSAWTTALKLSR